MTTALADMLGSKKFLAAILQVVLAGLMCAFVTKDLAVIAVLTAPLTGYTISQGIADHGKSAAEVYAKPAAEPTALDAALERAREASGGAS